VDVIVALYGWQAEGKEMVGFGQGLFAPESGWAWANATAAPAGGKADRIFAPGAEREVATFYHLGGKTTGSSSAVKIETLKARLFGGNQVAAAVLISAEDSRSHPARATIDGFLQGIGSVDALANGLIQTAQGAQ
jgi:EpsI family protein